MPRPEHTGFAITAALYGGAAVILAALGSHALDVADAPAKYSIFNNAVVFQLVHAVLLYWLAHQQAEDVWMKSARWSFAAGVLLFCGGLYVLVFFGKTPVSWITPIGGSLLILGWLNLSIKGLSALRK